MRRAFSVLAVTGCLLTGIPSVTLAQGLPGFTLFGGTKRGFELGYRLDYGSPNMWDRYRLDIKAKNISAAVGASVAIAQIAIDYPDYYKGEFDKKQIEVLVKNKKVALQEVNWDKENHRIDIYLQEPIPAGSNISVELSNVKNPSFGGMYNFNCRIITPGDVPLFRYIGTWVLSINS
jgi:hypothetical protein